MNFLKLFKWTPMAKRIEEAKTGELEALTEKIESDMLRKESAKEVREVRKIAREVHRINKENHFSPKLESLYTKGKASA